MKRQHGVFEHVCYHGTNAVEDFDQFRLSKSGAQGPGIYLADSLEAGAQYGGEMVIAAKVTLQSPFYFYPSDESLDALANPELLEQALDSATLQHVLDRLEREGMDGYGFEVMESLRRRGHDGIVMVYPFGDPVLPDVSGAAVIIAFEPGQVEILHRAPPSDPSWRASAEREKRPAPSLAAANATQQLRDFVEQHFGSDEAVGVWYLDDDGVTRYTLHEGIEMWNCLGEDCPGMSSMMPDGSSATVCTNYAIHIGRALPDRTQIFGFSNNDNPTSRVAREEIHPGGHDFALVDGRYLVDPWIRLVACEGDQIFFDLEDEQDAALVRDIYGPRECWKHMLLTEEAYRPSAPGHTYERPSHTDSPALDF